MILEGYWHPYDIQLLRKYKIMKIMLSNSIHDLYKYCDIFKNFALARHISLEKKESLFLSIVRREIYLIKFEHVMYT